MVQQECLWCHASFLTKLSAIKRGNGLYCSRKCCGEAHKMGKLVECAICQTKIWRRPVQIKHSSSGLFFCSKKHSIQWKNHLRTEEKHPNWKGGKSSYRKRTIRDSGFSCVSGENCPLKDKNLPWFMYEVDHLDGNRDNNEKENLRTMCVWCHKQKTYRIPRHYGGSGVIAAHEAVNLAETERNR